MDLRSRTVPERWTTSEGSVYEKNMVEQYFLIEKMRTLFLLFDAEETCQPEAVYC